MLEKSANTIHILEPQVIPILMEKMPITRATPYLPSFNNIPARTMEPLVLASTCAFGNQKWNPSIGILIRNGVNIKNITLLNLKKFLLIIKEETSRDKITIKYGIEIAVV